jgi:hypothetical protein
MPPAMLGHLFAVAREMPPEKGARYLQIMLDATCVLQAPYHRYHPAGRGSGVDRHHEP